MKKYLQILIAAILVDSACALTLSEIQVAYQAQVLKIDEERKASIGTLNRGYLKALEKIQKSFQKAGDLKRVLLVKEEAEAISKETWPLLALPEEIDRRVGPSRKLYLKSYVKIDRAWAVSSNKASSKMLDLLKKKRIELTKNGVLEDAQKAQMLIDVINKDSEVVRARGLIERLALDGTARGAMVLRRSGDQVEVLVRYDSSGKISLKSPVENVVELTDGRRERGETEAKTLGEFVGAKGFDTHPCVIYSESASGKLEFSGTIGCSANKVVEEEGQKGVELQILKNATNAYTQIPSIVSPIENSATHRLTLSYFIPSTNNRLSGINLHQGDSKGPRISPTFETVGKWKTEVREFVSGTSLDTLRFHFKGPKLGKYSEAAGDQILIGSLKVEYISFSAFVVEKFEKDGNPKVRDLSSDKQKIFIKNGILLPN